jgi:hypothetical protein
MQGHPILMILWECRGEIHSTVNPKEPLFLKHAGQYVGIILKNPFIETEEDASYGSRSNPTAN